MSNSIEIDTQVGIQESEYAKFWDESTTLSGLGDFFIEDIVIETIDQPPQYFHRDLSQEYESISVMIPDLESNLFEMQSYLAYMCLCANHGDFETSFGLDNFNIETPMAGFSGEHGDHDHCEVPNCGGHFDENGYCEKCGSKRKNKI